MVKVSDSQFFFFFLWGGNFFLGRGREGGNPRYLPPFYVCSNYFELLCNYFVIVFVTDCVCVWVHQLLVSVLCATFVSTML